MNTAATNPPPALVQALITAVEQRLGQGDTYQSLSVKAITQTAGVPRSTFYCYYKGKDDLAEKMVRHLIEQMFEAARAWYERPDLATREDLETALTAIVAVYQQHRSLFLAVVENSHHEASLASLFRHSLNDIVTRNRRTLKRSSHAPQARKPIAAEVMDVLVWMTERSCYQISAQANSQQQRRLIKAMTHIIWHSLFRDQ